MKYVLGIDLGTSAVKVLLVNQKGEVCLEKSESYPLIQPQSGFMEQDPKDWVEKTSLAISKIVNKFDGNKEDIEGISFSGQMHGLVLLNKEGKVLRNAILWNDTRTTKQCENIYETVAKERLLEITKNPALEGFTLPKIIWVKENESKLFQEADSFMLPKDYVRFRMTGKKHTDYSDAAGTLLLNIADKTWSKELCDAFGIDIKLCPPLVESSDFVGYVTNEFALRTGLSEKTKVFAGGADNACGAIGTGILSDGKILSSIGTSGVVLSYEEDAKKDFNGKIHYFNHSEKDRYYSMGVTLSAGYSLSWFKQTFAKNEDFEVLLQGIKDVPIGSRGLLFTPYITGERTPYADANIRGSFIGIDAIHKRDDFVRSVIEGITFSLNETIEVFRNNNKKINEVISIGGGAKNEEWLQIQADIFNAPVVKLESEQGPSLGAVILAAYGCGWFSSLKEGAEHFIKPFKHFEPIKDHVEKYKKIYSIYKKMYKSTKDITKELQNFKND